MQSTTSFDSKALRQALGDFVTGVTIVTTVDAAGRLYGLTVNSFNSVSLDPPLILWSQSNTAPSHAVFGTASSFAINILAEDQIELSNRFARSGADKFAAVAFEYGVHGLPLLAGCRAWLECAVSARIPGGDHTIYIGEVKAIRRAERKPLAFGGGQYLVTDPHHLGGPGPGAGISAQAQLSAVRLGTRAMARLSREHDQTLTLAVWGNRGPTIVAWEPSSSPLSGQLPLGLVLPVTTSATGRALAAHLPDQVVSALAAAEFAGCASSCGRAADDPARCTWAERWRHELRLVHEHGLAGREPGPFHGEGTLMQALSAPVLDAGGLAVMAITAVGDAAAFDGKIDTPFAVALRATAQSLSFKLGYSPDAHTASGAAKEAANA